MNKKILSIFALIMALSFAVSCSNENTTGNGGNNDGGATGGNPVAVSLKTATDGEEANSTLASEYDGSAFPDVTINVTGDDAANMVKEASGSSDKILVSVKSVSSVKKDSYKELTGIKTEDVTIKSVSTASGTEAVVLTVKNGANIIDTTGTANILDSDTPAEGEKAIIKVELDFKDESGVKTTKTLTVYVTVKNAE